MEHFIPVEARREQDTSSHESRLGLPTLLLIGLLQLGLTSEARAGGKEAPNCALSIRNEAQPPKHHFSTPTRFPLPISAPKYPEFWDREQKTRFQWDSRISISSQPKK